MKAAIFSLLFIKVFSLVSVPITSTPPSYRDWRAVISISKIEIYKGAEELLQTNKLLKTINTVPVSIGHPPQVFNVSIDVESQGFWVTSEECESLGCYKREGYDNTVSVISKPGLDKTSIKFQSGSGQGVQTVDTVSIGGVRALSFSFTELQQVSGAVFAKTAFDGVIGLSWSGSDAENTPNLFSALYAQGAIYDNSFSVSFSTVTGNQLLLGGVDPALASNAFIYYPLLPNRKWAVGLDDIQFDGVSLGVQQLVGIFDFGTALFAASKNLTEQIAGGIGLVKEDCSNKATLPVVTLVIGGVSYPLTPEDYILQVKEVARTQCFIGFIATKMPEGEDNSLIIGDAFARKFYTHFDFGKKQIGFAQAI